MYGYVVCGIWKLNLIFLNGGYSGDVLVGSNNNINLIYYNILLKFSSVSLNYFIFSGDSYYVYYYVFIIIM